ncbi:MAG TPA: quinolinate synthase NadA [Limnochordia bacterium]
MSAPQSVSSGSTATIEEIAQLQREIRELAARRNAVILAHNYERPEVQDVADYVGDSLGLAQAGARTDAAVIVFCGVHFMAETSAILSPEKTVLLPDLDAGCSLAATITAEQLRAWKAEHPSAAVVAYVNTTAEVKAEADICCTSTNAVRVVESIPPEREILFLPDMFLGSFVERQTGRKNMHIWMGECHVHAGIRPEEIAAVRNEHPKAEFLIHPECGCVSQCLDFLAAGDIDAEGTHVLSTGGMLAHARGSASREFVIATETGILHRLRKENPDKEFVPVNEAAVCQYMKKITLPKVLRSLREDVYRITVPEPIASRARVPIERMLQLG